MLPTPARPAYFFFASVSKYASIARRTNSAEDDPVLWLIAFSCFTWSGRRERFARVFFITALLHHSGTWCQAEFVPTTMFKLASLFLELARI